MKTLKSISAVFNSFDDLALNNKLFNYYAYDYINLKGVFPFRLNNIDFFIVTPKELGFTTPSSFKIIIDTAFLNGYGRVHQLDIFALRPCMYKAQVNGEYIIMGMKPEEKYGKFYTFALQCDIDPDYHLSKQIEDVKVRDFNGWWIHQIQRGPDSIIDINQPICFCTPYRKYPDELPNITDIVKLN